MNVFNAWPFDIFGNGNDSDNGDSPGSEQLEPMEEGISYFGNDAGPFLYPDSSARDNLFRNDSGDPAEPDESPSGFFGNQNAIEIYAPYSTVASNGGYETADDRISGYHFLSLVAGDTYTISALREEDDLDPGMWLFEGHRSFQSFLESGTLSDDTNFTPSTIGYITFSDDVIPHPGPYSDPSNTITAPESGKVTVVVTNVASGSDDGGDGRFAYSLEITPDPLDVSGEAEGSSPESFFGTEIDVMGDTMPPSVTGFFGNEIFLT